jgi:hypothetical protein
MVMKPTGRVAIAWSGLADLVTIQTPSEKMMSVAIFVIQQ